MLSPNARALRDVLRDPRSRRALDRILNRAANQQILELADEARAPQLLAAAEAATARRVRAVDALNATEPGTVEHLAALRAYDAARTAERRAWKPIEERRAGVGSVLLGSR
jgi:hypothetical protein